MRNMKQAGILVAVLLLISTENCNGSVLKNLDEDYRRADELKKPAVFEGKVKRQNDRNVVKNDFIQCYSF